MNVFSTLRIAEKEDPVTNALCSALNESEDFRDFFLNRICSEGAKSSGFKAIARVRIKGAGVPDLILKYEVNQTQKLIIIENKLFAGEGKDQTRRYASDEAIMGYHKKYGKNLKFKFVFLTLYPEQDPLCASFTSKCYSQLCDYSVTYGEDERSELSLFLEWIDLAKYFYASGRYEPEKRICDVVKSDNGISGSYMFFRSLMKEIRLPDGLELKKSYHKKETGRSYYLSMFSKPSWCPEEMDLQCLPCELNPEKHFNIHFEPQYEILGNRFSVHLHYEINPYFPKSWANKNIKSEGYKIYESQREQFKERFRIVASDDWDIKGGSNQIAVLNRRLETLSSEEVVSKLTMLFKEASILIDNCLEGTHEINT